jgi:hypothetical protein
VQVVFQVGEEKISHRIWMTEKALKHARKTLKVLGFDPDTQDCGELDTKPQLLAGAKCSIVVEHEEYNDEVRAKVQWVNSLRKPADANVMARMTKALRAAKSKKQTVPDTDADGFAPPSKDDDEIPF